MTRLAQELRRLLRDAVPAGFYGKAAWQYVATFATAGWGFVYVMLVSAALGAAEFGRMAAALGFVMLTFQFFELRMHEAVIRYVAEFRERGDDGRLIACVKLFLAADAVTGALAFGVVAAAAPLAARWLLKEQDASLILAAGLAVLVQNVSTATSEGLFRVYGAFRDQAVIAFIGGMLKVGVTLVALKMFGAGAYGVLVVAAAAHLVTNFLFIARAVAVLFRHVRREAEAPLSALKGHLRQIRRFVTSTYLLSISMVPTKDLDVALLAYFQTPAVVGIFKMAKTYFSVFTMLVDPAFFVIYPEIAAMWIRRQIGALRDLIRSITVVFAVAGAAVCVIAALVVPRIIVWLAGPAYASSGSVFRWMIFSLVTWAPLIWVNPLLMAAERAELTTKASIIGSTFITICFLLFIPRLGAHGAALAQALTPAVVMAAAVLMGMRAGLIPPRERPA